MNQNIASQQQTKIAISGASGFIGKQLRKFLINNKHQVVSIGRNDLKQSSEQLAEKLEGCESIINLSGAPITRKWTRHYKEEILNSRVNTTKKLVSAIKVMEHRPKAFISTSAVGIYDSYEVHDEFSTSYAKDFLGKVCKKWESQAFKVQKIDGIRLCIIRLGVVLGQQGGAFPKIVKPFRFFMGAKLGDGHQLFPFIHIDDVKSVVWYLLKRKECHGIYNLVAPEMISNLELTEALKSRLHKSIVPVVPEGMLRLLYKEGAQVLLTGQKVVPKRLEKDGFHFSFPTLNACLDDLLK